MGFCLNHDRFKWHINEDYPFLLEVEGGSIWYKVHRIAEEWKLREATACLPKYMWGRDGTDFNTSFLVFNKVHVEGHHPFGISWNHLTLKTVFFPFVLDIDSHFHHPLDWYQLKNGSTRILHDQQKIDKDLIIQTILGMLMTLSYK